MRARNMSKKYFNVRGMFIFWNFDSENGEFKNMNKLVFFDEKYINKFKKTSKASPMC